MKTKLLFEGLAFILIAIFFVSCQEQIYDNNELHIPYVKKDTNLDIKKQFSMALAKVINENKDVRDLIKQNALKKINYDYDVLYTLVKDEKLSSGNTLRESLLRNMDESILLSIESKIPNLTIFVPELPFDCFSAELWDTENQIPVVGIRTSETNDVPYFDNSGVESVIESHKIPSFPIVVVKENERIVVSNASTRSLSSTAFSSKTNTDYEFVFLDNAFDNISNKTHKNLQLSQTRAGTSTIRPNSINKIYEAYDIYKNVSGWHRDYLYYNITPSQQRGPFDYNYKENLLTFEMVGDARSAMNKIADQTDDPRVNGKWNKKIIDRGDGTSIIQYTPWTDGEFEFKVKVYVANTNSFGNEIVTYFRARPTALFDITPVSEDKNKSFTIRTIENKVVDLKLPLFEWDLASYGAGIKIAIEEVDAQQSIVQTSSSSSEFATNFGFDATIGETTKIGLKFGASNKETRTVTYQVTTTQGNDELGEVIVNFGDDIILSKDLILRTDKRGNIKRPDYNNKYHTGWYRICIAPVRVN